MNLVNLGNHIYATRSSYYNPLSRIMTRSAGRIIQQAMQQLQYYLILPDDQRVVIRHLPEEINACFMFVSQQVHIDPRRDTVFDLVETLAHECVHAEQYFTNRVGFRVTEHDQYIRYEGTLYQVTDQNVGDETHPWETEAYERQHQLATLVCRSIKGVLNVDPETALGVD